jgi:nitroreductase
MSSAEFIPLSGYQEYSSDEMSRRAGEFLDEMRRRRSVRQFSDRPVPGDVIRACLMTAGSAPSGANLQPWHFVVVSDPEVKHQIRVAAEAEEHVFYAKRAPKAWLDALAPLGTDEHKPYLETAPYLIAIFSQSYGIRSDGRKVKHYYSKESVGIATGFLITALHHAGLVCLTHTPSPMGFLNQILTRPANETPFSLLVVGFPSENAAVPRISKKPLKAIATFLG